MTTGSTRGAGAVQTGRPLCACHGEPADNGGDGYLRCAVKRRARRRALYHADPAAAKYVRVRHALRARIRAKRARITELENELATQDRG